MTRPFLQLVLFAVFGLPGCADERTTPRSRSEWTTIELARTDEQSGHLEITNRSGYHLYAVVEIDADGSANVEPDAPIAVQLDPWQSGVPVHRVSGVSLDENWTLQPYTTSSPGDPSVGLSTEPYALPFPCGVRATVTQAADRIVTHDVSTERFAVDFGLSEGTPVTAMRDGRVVEAEDSSQENCAGRSLECNKLTNLVVIQHDDHSIAEYLHLAHASLRVRPGDWVVSGQHIADSGNTGFSSAPHLHVAVATAFETALPRSLKIRFATETAPAVEPRTGVSYAPAGCGES